MNYMFSDCTSLKSIDLSKLNTPKLSTMNNMFYNCGSLEAIALPKKKKYKYF